MRKTLRGYTDFGTVRIPPLPQRMVLTDRATGTLWLLSHSDRTEQSADGEGHFAINSVFNEFDKDLIIYEAYGEPRLPENPRIRIIVRGGRLGYEWLEDPVWERDRDNAPIRSRRGAERKTRTIVQPADWRRPPDRLAWVPRNI